MATARASTRVPATAMFDALVVESIVETADTRTLVLDVGPHQPYRAGQYVSIDPHQFPALGSMTRYLEHLKGRVEPPRAYSMCSAPHEPYVAITVKEEVYDGVMAYPPLLSGFLVHSVRAGDRMAALGFAGGYVLPEVISADHILHLCAGSGSVPNVSMLKDALGRHPNLRHTFVYSNKTWDDVIFRDLLTQLAVEHPSRLQVIHTLTREPEGSSAAADVRRGRVTQEVLGAVLEREPNTLIYMCGPAISVWDRRAHALAGTTAPPRFLETMMIHLKSLEVPRDRIKMEAFG